MEDDDWLQRGILVSNLPTSDDVTRDKLEIHFSKRSNGGGDVENIIMLDHYTAMVKFKDEKTLESVLSTNPQRLLDSILNITRYTKSVAEELKTVRNLHVNRFGSFQGSENDYDESDGLESDEQSIPEQCSCNELFKIFDKVSVSIPFGKLQAGLITKGTTLNRISVKTGIKWEVNKSQEILVLSGCYDEIKKAAGMLQHYTNDVDLPQNGVEYEEPRNFKINEDRVELPARSPLPSPSLSPINRPRKIHKTESYSSDCTQEIEKRTSVNDESRVELDKPILKLRPSQTEGNLHGKKSSSPLKHDSASVSSEQSGGGSPDGDLETDGDVSISERSWSPGTPDLEEPKVSSVQKERLTAKIDVACLDPKLLHYVMRVKKNDVENIQEQFSVKFITTDKGQVAIEVRRDDNLMSNSKNAIQGFQALLDKIREQDPEPKTLCLKDLHLTYGDTKRICQRAQNDNPEVTVILDDDDESIQIYGTSSALEKAQEWFSENVFAVHQQQQDQSEDRLGAQIKDVRHKVSELSLTEDTKRRYSKEAQKVEPINIDMPSGVEEMTTNNSNLSSLKKDPNKNVTITKKEETKPVKSPLEQDAESRDAAGDKASRLNIRRSVNDPISAQSSTPEDGRQRSLPLSTKCENQQATASASLNSTRAKSASHKLNSSSRNHSDKISDRTPKSKQVAEEVFDQKILDFIQSVHYKALNEIQKKHEVTLEMKGYGRVQIRSNIAGCQSNAKLKNARAALTRLVEKCVEGKFVTCDIDLRDLDVQQTILNSVITKVKENRAILVTNGPGYRIEFYGDKEEVDMAVDELHEAIKLGKVDNTRETNVKVVGKPKVKEGLRFSDSESTHGPEQKLISRGIQDKRTTYDTDEADDVSFQKARRNEQEFRSSKQTSNPEDFHVPNSTSSTAGPGYSTSGDNFKMNGIWRDDYEIQEEGCLLNDPRAYSVLEDDSLANVVSMVDTDNIKVNGIWEDTDEIQAGGGLLNDPRMYGDFTDDSSAGPLTSGTLVRRDPDENESGHWYDGGLKSVVAANSVSQDFSSLRSQTNVQSMEYLNGACGGDFDDSDDENPPGDLLNDIRMYGDLDSFPDEIPESALLSLKTSAGFDIQIYEGDITLEFVSVIVCSADPYLGTETAAARAIKDAAGPELVKDCQKWVALRGEVDPSRPVYTSGGNLTCSQVLHVVPPDGSSTEMRRDNPLVDMLHGVMKICARPLEAASIAMPAIGIDSLQVDEPIYAKYLFEAFVHCILSPPHTKEGALSLETFKIVDKNTSLVKTLKAVFTSMSSEPRYKRLFQPRRHGSVSSSEAQSQTTEHSNMFKTGGARPKKGNTSKRNQSRERNKDGQHSKNRRGRFENRNFIKGSMAARFDKAEEDDVKMPSISSSLSQQDGDDGGDGNKCPVCLDTVKEPSRTLKCKHTFCKHCLDQSVKHQGQTCPVCKQPFGKGRRTRIMPPGKMDVRYDKTTRIPGYPGAQGSIIITYRFTSGVQGPLHPHPGRTYHGTTRTAYLPDSPEGRDVLGLLKRAFDSRLTFTIGQSSSTGQQDVIIWNDIHHKTNVTGGPANYGYPDPTYLARVRKELEDKGIR